MSAPGDPDERDARESAQQQAQRVVGEAGAESRLDRAGDDAPPVGDRGAPRPAAGRSGAMPRSGFSGLPGETISQT